MAIPIVSQNPTPYWVFDMEFPVPIDTDVAPLNFGSGAFGRMHWSTGFTAQTTGIWSQVPGTVQASGAAGANINGGQQMFMAMGGANPGDFFRAPFGPWQFWPDTGSGDPLAAGSSQSPLMKVWWLKFLMRSPHANPNSFTGVLAMPTNNRNNVGWPLNGVGATNRGGFGFVGDGAGQWQYASFDRSGVGSTFETVALPTHLTTDWNLFELQCVNARPGFPATVTAHFNGALVLTRGWASGLLEDYAANEYRFVPVFAGGDQKDGWWKSVVIRKGEFTRDGQKV